MRSPLSAIPAPALVLLSMASVQVGAAIAKGLFAQAPPSSVAFLRLAFAAVILVVVTRAALRPVLKAATRIDVAVILGFGLALATMNATIYESFARIPLGVAVTIEFVGPLGVALALSRRWVDLLWVGLAATGIGLFARGGGELDPWGIGLAFVAAAAWACYILLSAQTGRRFPGSSGLALASVAGALVVAPVGLASGGTALWHLDLLGPAIVVAVLSSVLPYTWELEALRRIPPHVFGILLSLAPAVAALAGLVLLGELLSTREWLAVGCVVAASLGATSSRAPRRRHRLGSSSRTGPSPPLDRR